MMAPMVRDRFYRDLNYFYQGQGNNNKLYD